MFWGPKKIKSLGTEGRWNKIFSVLFSFISSNNLILDMYYGKRNCFEKEIIQGNASGQQRRGRESMDTLGGQCYMVGWSKARSLAMSSWRQNKLRDDCPLRRQSTDQGRLTVKAKPYVQVTTLWHWTQNWVTLISSAFSCDFPLLHVPTCSLRCHCQHCFSSRINFSGIPISENVFADLEHRSVASEIFLRRNVAKQQQQQQRGH